MADALDRPLDHPLDLTAATRRLVRTADTLTDAQHAEPSGLPGWTRAHVLAHLALNAEGLAAALGGIVEGRRVPVYRSQQARDEDIETLAAASPGMVRTRLLGGCTALSDAIGAVPDDAAQTTIERVPGGPVFPAGEVPWMRLREVEIHHADLGVGYARSDWEPAFATGLIDWLVSRNDAEPPFLARATDVDRTWTFGAGGPVVSGRAADLAWWLTGRGAGEGLTSEGGELPQIGAW